MYYEVDCLTEDLRCVNGESYLEGLSINRVFKTLNSFCDDIFDESNLQLIWEREKEINWENVPVGTKVLVRDCIYISWMEAMFVKIEKGEFPFEVIRVDNKLLESFKYCKLKEE